MERRRRPVLRCFAAGPLLPRSFAAASSLTTLPMRAHCTCGYTNGGRDSDRPLLLGTNVVRRARRRGPRDCSRSGRPRPAGRAYPTVWAQSCAPRARPPARTCSMPRAAPSCSPPRPRLPAAPASVEKVYTTATALRRYGVTGTLDTSACRPPAIGGDGTLGGDLVPQRGRRPHLRLRAFARRNYGGDARSRAWPRLRAAGRAACSGDVVGDESAFDALRGGPQVALASTPTSAPLSALASTAICPGASGRAHPSRARRRRGASWRRRSRAGIAVRQGARAARAPAGARRWPRSTRRRWAARRA